MAAGYLIIVFRSVTDPSKVDDYRKLAAPVLEKHARKFVVRGPAKQAYEDGVLERVVVAEFESVDDAVRVYESPEYQEAVAAMGDGAVRDVRIVEGL